MDTKNQAQIQESLYERFGGDSAIAEMVDQFYYRVLFDKNLRNYFLKADMSRVRAMQKRLFSVLMGSTQIYEGKELKELHKPLKIRDFHFDAFVSHMNQVLSDMEKPASMIQEILKLLEENRKYIVTQEE